MHREHGFSLLEVIVATALMMTVTAAIFTVMNPSQGTFAAQPEVADMQQRLRVAQDTLYKDLIMAGAGMYKGQHTPLGALIYSFAPILPYRQGAVKDDGPQQFFSDRITLFYVPQTTAQTFTTEDITPGAGPVVVNVAQAEQASDCPKIADGTPNGATDKLCGFNVGDTALIFDYSGNYDTFFITDTVNTGKATMTLNRPPDATPTTYQGGSNVVKVIERNYYLKADAANKVFQLMYYDGSNNADFPIVDHVVGLTFEYYGDPQPPQRTLKPLSDASGPWTSYGPRPPGVGFQIPGEGYPKGENCTFMMDGGNLVPRLPVLGDAANPNTLVKLTAAQLTDGPWCPDATNTNRWDADLLRIRKIGVTLRVEAAIDALRGPASALFARAGTSRGGTAFAPDQEVRFMVAPRNMNLGR